MFWWLSIAVAAPLVSGPHHVVGGSLAEPGAWPATGAMMAADGEFICSGVLVSPTLVVTAGHCDLGIDHVILDTTDFTEGGEVVAVDHTVTHPNLWTTFDITAVVLATPAETEPVPLMSGCAAGWLVDGAQVAIVGYGATDESGLVRQSLLYEAITTVGDADCSDPARGCNELVLPEGEVIAGGDGVDSCNGDSGGPLYLDAGEDLVLAGITSRAAIPRESACGSGGIYVRMDAVVDWLEDNTGLTLASGPCDDPVNRPPTARVPTVTARSGIAVRMYVEVEDPDEGDTHTLTLGAGPAHGTVEQRANGQFWYRSEPGYEGLDHLSFTIVDEGSPPFTVTANGVVEVLPAPEIEAPRTCGTVDTSGFGASWLMGLAGLIARRRR